MKKLIALVLILALAVSALCGCSALEEVISDQTITRDVLTITFPGYYLNLSDEDYAEGMEFLYGFNNTAVMGIKEDRATLEAILPGLTAQDYADLFIESNNLATTAAEKLRTALALAPRAMTVNIGFVVANIYPLRTKHLNDLVEYVENKLVVILV